MASRPIKVMPASKYDKTQVAIAAKHNGLYATNLKIALEFFPKYVLGTYAATLLDSAIRETWSSSGRFAANWRLALNGAAPDPKPNPMNYGDTGEEYGSIGERADNRYSGSKRRFPIGVLMAKRTYYGYRKGSNGYMALTRGQIADALYPHTKTYTRDSNMTGRAGKILLYNPFFKPNQRKASWFPKYHPASLGRLRADGTPAAGYAQIAMGRHPDLGPPGPMGSGMLQKLVYDLAMQIRKDSAAGLVTDPRRVTLV